jgi:acid stress chaperone HdeA
MKRISVIIAAMTVIAGATAQAAMKKTPPKPIEKITCRDFIALDNVFKPQAVSLALGYDRAKRPDAEIVDVTGIDRVVPVIITSCRARPSETLLQRVRARLHKL